MSPYFARFDPGFLGFFGLRASTAQDGAFKATRCAWRITQ